MRRLLIFLVLSLGWAASHALPFVTTPNPSTYPIHWYKLKIAGYYLCSNYTELNATESSSSADEYLWCFLQSSTGKIVIYNKAIGKCMSDGWEFTPYWFSQSTNYVEEGSGSNFYICSNAFGTKQYMQCDYGQISFSPNKVDAVTAIQVLVEDYIEPTGTLVFPDPTVYDDHCTIEFDYHPSEADGGCELRLYINGTWVGMPYWIQRTNDVQTIEATAKVIFSNPRIRTIEVTKTFEIPALEGTGDVGGDVNGDGTVTAADITALYDFMLNNDSSHIVNGDQNGDGTITAADVTAVYNILLGN